MLQTIAGPSVVSRRRMGARRRGTDGQASTGTFQLSDGCRLPNKPPPPCGPLQPHTQLLETMVPALREQEIPRQALVLREASFSPHLQAMGDAWRSVHSELPRPLLLFPCHRSLPPPSPHHSTLFVLSDQSSQDLSRINL